MFKFKKKEPFKSIGNGTIVALENVPDQVFSKKILGDGFAFNLSEGKVFSPLSGEVTVAFPTGHAFGIKAKTGEEILIHIGIDTVELDGQGFTSLVKQGDKVKQGDILSVVDLDLIRELGKNPIVMVIFTSGETLKDLKIGADLNTDSDSFLNY